MIKSTSIYSKKQPECTALSMDGLSYIYICENETEVTTEDGTTQYQYDLYSLRCDDGKVDLTAVKANPKKYLDFEPKADTTQAEKNAGDIAYMSMMMGVEL